MAGGLGWRIGCVERGIFFFFRGVCVWFLGGWKGGLSAAFWCGLAWCGWAGGRLVGGVVLERGLG